MSNKRFLIITQVIDTDHPILGFFHRWVAEFAAQCEHVHVIALQVGKHDLPANVTVHSLGKEHHQAGGPSLRRSAATGKVGPRAFSNTLTKLRYTIRFYRLIWRLRHEYDNVFVHMNQIYVLLGTPLWRVWRKQVGLWYAHGTVSPSLHAAVRHADFVFTSTPEGLQIDTPKRILVGQGIDTAVFKLSSTKPAQPKSLQLVTVGRISQSKNIGTLLQACAALKQAGFSFHFNIIGVGTTPAEASYEQQMRSLAHTLKLEAYVAWVGAVTQQKLPGYLQAADIFIHDGATNSLDKVLLEAVLCGCTVISSNPAYRSLTESIEPRLLFASNNHQQLSQIIQEAATWPTKRTTTTAIRVHVQKSFSITGLVSAIVGTYK